jgi:hypothetical protein
MNLRRIGILLVVILLSQFSLFSQQIDSMMNLYVYAFPKEKIHVHFDKTVYNKEETIWYKIYILDDQGLTHLSKNVYVEWFDTTGKMIRQMVSPLYQSTSKGAFDIPSEYTGNFLRMKVYTQWSLNDEPDFQYVRDLVINNNTPTDLKKRAIPTTQVELFPEGGGDLVNGLVSKIAFKASNNFGLPVAIKGILMTETNKVIDTLKVKHDGMGIFLLLPKAGEKYWVKWSDPLGNTGTTALPAAKTEGVTLSITPTNEFAAVKIERSLNVPESLKKMYLMVHMNQSLLFKVDVNAKEKTGLLAKIPITEMSTGVLQFTLFNENWQPLAERILFVNNRSHEFGAKLIPQMASLTKRGKNVFDVYVSDTVATNMSISVTDASIEPVIAPNTIYSDLMLSGEIRGKIHNPGYYLSTDADSVTAHLDLVMLTHGWRRFNWEKLKAGIPPELKYLLEKDWMKIAGKVNGMKSISVNDLLLNMIIQHKDSSRKFIFQPVSKEGTFENHDVFFYDTVRIFYSFNKNQQLDAMTQIQFDNGLLKPTAKNIAYNDDERRINWNDSLAKSKMNYFLQLQEDWKKRSMYKSLQEVVIKARVKPKEDAIDQRYATGLFSGGDAFVFDIMSDPAANMGFDIMTYLQGRVPGLQISRAGSSTTMSWRGGTPEIYIDQMRVDPSMVQNISMNDIAMVKVFRPPFFGGSGGGDGGAISIYTKKGGDTRSSNTGKNSKGMLSTLMAGFTRFKEFYNPQYDNPSENPETDIRTTLYWNPYIITNKKSPRFRVQFYNNDISKKLLVVLEGVNAEGKMTRVTMPLE